MLVAYNPIIVLRNAKDKIRTKDHDTGMMMMVRVLWCARLRNPDDHEARVQNLIRNTDLMSSPGLGHGSGRSRRLVVGCRQDHGRGDGFRKKVTFARGLGSLHKVNRSKMG